MQKDVRFRGWENLSSELSDSSKPSYLSFFLPFHIFLLFFKWSWERRKMWEFDYGRKRRGGKCLSFPCQLSYYHHHGLGGKKTYTLHLWGKKVGRRILLDYLTGSTAEKKRYCSERRAHPDWLERASSPSSRFLFLSFVFAHATSQMGYHPSVHDFFSYW